MSWVDWLIIIIPVVTVLTIGFNCRKYIRGVVDFLAWLREGSLDWVFPTGYVYDMLRFKIWCKRQIDASNKANPQILCAPTIGVISSHGALQNSDELIEQIKILRDLGASGISFFRWEKLRDWLTPLRKSCFQNPVAVP